MFDLAVFGCAPWNEGVYNGRCYGHQPPLRLGRGGSSCGEPLSFLPLGAQHVLNLPVADFKHVGKEGNRKLSFVIKSPDHRLQPIKLFGPTRIGSANDLRSFVVLHRNRSILRLTIGCSSFFARYAQTPFDGGKQRVRGQKAVIGDDGFRAENHCKATISGASKKARHDRRRADYLSQAVEPARRAHEARKASAQRDPNGGGSSGGNKATRTICNTRNRWTSVY